jgi:DNA-binding MarR family transcriptional regulator
LGIGLSNPRKKSPPAASKASTGGLQTFRTLASFRLHVLARLSERLHEQHYKKVFGLNLRECRIIGIVGGYGESSFKRTWEESNLDKAHVSRLITRLIKLGLLTKITDPLDQRTIKIALTTRGRITHKALHAAAVSLNEAWLSSISAQQLESFSTCLDILTASARDICKSQEAMTRPRRGTPDRPA